MKKISAMIVSVSALVFVGNGQSAAPAGGGDGGYFTMTIGEARSVYAAEAALSKALNKAVGSMKDDPDRSENELRRQYVMFKGRDTSFFEPAFKASRIRIKGGVSSPAADNDSQDSVNSLGARMAQLAAYKMRFHLRWNMERTVDTLLRHRFCHMMKVSMQTVKVLDDGKGYFEEKFRQLDQSCQKFNVDTIHSLGGAVDNALHDDSLGRNYRAQVIKIIGLEGLVRPTKPLTLNPKFEANLKVLDKWIRNVSTAQLDKWKSDLDKVKERQRKLEAAMLATDEALANKGLVFDDVRSKSGSSYFSEMHRDDFQFNNRVRVITEHMDKLREKIKDDEYIARLRTAEKLLPSFWAKTGGGDPTARGNGYHDHLMRYLSKMETRLAAREKYAEALR